MLQTLRIQNYALIDDVEVNFTSGFNVLTGETGAGKSIIIHALNLILGARASSDAVRSGNKQAKIDAIFHLPTPSPELASLLEEQAIVLDDDELHITRIVSAEGRSRAYAGGTLIPVGILDAIGQELVDLHGQHEHQSLVHPDKQRDLLDAYSGTLCQRDALAQAVEKWRALEHEIQSLESTDREQTRHLEFLKFEVEEIDNAEVAPDEEKDLESRRNRITNAEVIYQSTAQLTQWLSESEGSPPAADLLGMASRELEHLASLDAQYTPLLDSIEGLREQLLAQVDEIQGLAQGVEYDPEELERINTRLNLLRELKRKYGDTLDAVLAYAEEAREKIAAYENRDTRLAELRQQEQDLYQSALSLAQKLSKSRKAKAKKLGLAISSIVQELGMSGAEFQIEFGEIPLCASGIDAVEFLLAANPGEPAKGLRQVASGGEVSRIMLAIKSVFAESDAIPTMIFDEIDTGVGGAIANHIGTRLKMLAADHQTICITHLPQIAAAADTHYQVAKSTTGKTTTTTILQMNAKERVEEVARLLDGDITALSMDHAEALLKELAS
ncbi:MAG: DNA repair protein RecN [Candidatus Hydrogenedentota bacterium]